MKWHELACIAGELMGVTGQYDSKSREQRQAAAVVMAGLIIGPNVKRICRWSGYPRERVLKYASNLWKQGIWHRGGIHMDEGEESGVQDMELILMTCAALGEVVKTPNGLDLYRERIVELLQERKSCHEQGSGASG